MSRTLRLLAGAAMALGIGFGTANANLLVNPGFETGDATGWTTSGPFTIVADCTISFPPCAPGGGTYYAAINPGATSASFIQTVQLPGPGNYHFGATVSFGVVNPNAPGPPNTGGNFDQGQISLTIQLPGGQSETVGFDPNALNGQFTEHGLAVSFTPWFELDDFLNYAGGPVDALINVNVQEFTAPTGNLFLVFDNVFIQAVPEPSALLILGSALAGLLGARRRAR
jgi:hypothetical protein